MTGEVATFKRASKTEIEDLIREAESHAGVIRWVLFVKRGPVAPTIIQDGAIARAVVQPTRPEPPYEGYVFACRNEDAAALELKLRMEVSLLGAYNLVARPARLEPVAQAVAPAFWN